MDESKIPEWFKNKVRELKQQQNTESQFVKWGRLGGRPKSDIRKSERITLRFTPDEMKILKRESEKKNISLTDYSRIILLNKKIPDANKNLQLIEYGNNFSRLSNYIKSGIFTPEEKSRFLTELETTIQGIKNSINWEK